MRGYIVLLRWIQPCVKSWYGIGHADFAFSLFFLRRGANEKGARSACLPTWALRLLLAFGDTVPSYTAF